MVVLNLRFLAVVVMFSLVATSCGNAGEAPSSVADAVGAASAGSDNEGSEGTIVETLSVLQIEFEQPVIDAALGLIETLGVPEVVDAVILAVDAGYTADQLIRAASEATLRVDGTIQSEDGGTEPPVGEPAGLIDRGASDESAMPAPPTYQAVLISAAEGDSDIEGFREAARARVEKLLDQGQVNPDLVTLDERRAETRWGMALIMIIIELLRKGFTAEQALEGALYDDAYVETVRNVCSSEQRAAGVCKDEILCSVMYFPGAKPVAVGPRCPSQPDAAVSPTTTYQPTTQAPAEVDHDLVYRGSAEINLVYADLDGQDPLWPTSQCETAADAELTIRPDGTASLVVDWVVFVSAPGSGIFTGSDEGCMPNPWIDYDSIVVEGTWEDDEFSVGITEPYNRSRSPVNGSFGDRFAAAAENLTLESGPTGQPITGDLYFNLTRVTE